MGQPSTCARARELRRSNGAVDLTINAPGSFSFPASLPLSPELNRDEHLAEAGRCSPRACAKARGCAAVVEGFFGVAVAQPRVKARRGHGGGSTEFCGFSDDGDGVPANEQRCNHVSDARTGPGVHEEQE